LNRLRALRGPTLKTSAAKVSFVAMMVVRRNPLQPSRSGFFISVEGIAEP
jgi:hypothetical protein